MMGESILCAPLIDSAFTRNVYFPEGTWYDFNSNKKYEGGKTYTVNMSLSEIPMFVKANTILPLAQAIEYITPETIFHITCKAYGNITTPIKLFEDNPYNFDFEKGNYNWLQISCGGNKTTVIRSGKGKHKLYEIDENIERVE